MQKHRRLVGNFKRNRHECSLLRVPARKWHCVEATPTGIVTLEREKFHALAKRIGFLPPHLIKTGAGGSSHGYSSRKRKIGTVSRGRGPSTDPNRSHVGVSLPRRRNSVWRLWGARPGAIRRVHARARGCGLSGRLGPSSRRLSDPDRHSDSRWIRMHYGGYAGRDLFGPPGTRIRHQQGRTGIRANAIAHCPGVIPDRSGKILIGGRVAGLSSKTLSEEEKALRELEIDAGVMKKVCG